MKEKKEYQPPLLLIHGNVETLTQINRSHERNIWLGLIGVSCPRNSKAPHCDYLTGS